MSDTKSDEVPAGFEQLPPGLGFTDSLAPCYRRVEGDEVAFGLVVQTQHCNTMGNCHGGVLMSLSDITAATGANVAKGVIAGSPTVHLSIDYISTAREGEWIEARAEQVTAKRRFGFCSGSIVNKRGVVARFSGTFYFPDHDGLWRNGPPGDGVMVPTADKE